MRAPVGAGLGVALWLFAALLAGPVRAQSFVVLPPPPPVAPAQQTPEIEPPPDLTALAGKPVTRIHVALDGNVWTDVEIPTIHEVKPGELLTAAAVRRAMSELLGGGRFARVRASATLEEGGVALTLRAAPRKLVGRLELDLHGARLERDELLREADLAEGGELVGAELAGTRARIVRYCALHGYPAASVELRTRATDDPSRALVIVDVVPGPPRLVDDRRFYVFGSAPEPVMPIAEGYAVHPGDRADEPALDAADSSLEQALRIQGWYRADASHDLVRVDQAGRPPAVVLRVRIDAGPRQVVRFEGNDHYDTETLTAALALETESDRSPPHLSDKLRTFYQRRGFLDVEVRPEVRGGEADPVQLVVFHVDEHPRVAVDSRQYPCLRLDAIKRLSSGGPRSPADIGTEIDSYLEEELPGADLLVDPDPRGL
ncbi:MAG TPA: POTRA domain-containing protein, partial [Polyangiaceae bacterium]|nr:POTRA domain-containing protein [Polyangiaceae bacterium]